MVDKGLTCIPVPIAGTKKHFLRLINSTGHKQIGPKTLAQAFEAMDENNIKRVVNEISKTHELNLKNVLCQLVVNLVKEAEKGND